MGFQPELNHKNIDINICNYSFDIAGLDGDFLDIDLFLKHNIMSNKTHYEHDCDCCQYLGDYKSKDTIFDLYSHGEGNDCELIARYSSEGGDYSSGLIFAYVEKDSSHPLVEAKRRDLKEKLLDEKTFYLGIPKDTNSGELLSFDSKQSMELNCYSDERASVEAVDLNYAKLTPSAKDIKDNFKKRMKLKNRKPKLK